MVGDVVVAGVVRDVIVGVVAFSREVIDGLLEETFDFTNRLAIIPFNGWLHSCRDIPVLVCRHGATVLDENDVPGTDLVNR